MAVLVEQLQVLLRLNMPKSKDAKILWTMGITAFCLIVSVVCLVIVFNTDGVLNWRVLLPICVIIVGMVISASLLLFILKCGCKKADS